MAPMVGSEQPPRVGGRTCHGEGRPKAQVSASYVIHSKTYYLVKLAVGGSKARYYLKHYDDFVVLRQALQEFIDEKPWNEAPISILPQLPETGRFGLRRSLSTLGMGSFAKKLQEELDGWLQMILSQISTLSTLPALEDFFGLDPLPASMSDASRARLEDLHALLVRGASATEVADAAAKQEKEDDRNEKNWEGSDGEGNTLLQSRRRQLRTQKTAGALAFESAGVEKVDEKNNGEEVPVPSQRRRQLRTQRTAGALAFESAGLETVDEKNDGEEVPAPSQRRRQLRTQKTAGALAFESAGIETVGEKDNGEEVPAPSRRQLRTQKTAGALAFASAGLEEVDDKSGAEDERLQRVSVVNPRRRQLRTQGTAGALAFESAGF